ncbi:MAG: C40 family peptidase [Actinobacteria bacterium]|nr:C40 family peptidase [Actinomycetota bacterium]
MAAALATVKTASAEPPGIATKRAEAQNVLDQIQEVDAQLGRAVEAYNLANVKLDRIQAELKTNARHLVIARSSLRNAQTHLADRLVALYVGGSEDSTLEVLLGAQSLDDLLNRLDTVERVSDQDTRVLGEVTTLRAEVKLRKKKLSRARAEQAQVVSQKAQRRSWIQGQLAERQRMLASIKSEIASLEAAERLRQERLAAQARARLAAAQQEAAEAEPEPEPVAVSDAPELSSEASSVELESVAPPPARYGGVVGIAMQYLGVPYLWGGASPSGFDCSGLIMYVYAQVGVSLPHHAASQYGMGTPVSKDQLEPGDLVFFNGLGHNGMYIGGGQFIHAPHSGDVVKISSLSDSWYAQTWVGARRL